MLFSIIIPVYNVELYLRDCLNSVLGQTCPDWEAICVNDGSTDGSGDILEEYAGKDPRFKVVTKANGGLSSARNAGMEKAEGDYIVFLDSDDWLVANALEILAGKVNGEDMLCFSGRRFFEATETFNPSDRLPERFYGSVMEYYNENALQRRDEDNLFTPIVCYHASKVRTINESLYEYRVRGSSITTTSNPKRLKDMLGTANELAAFFIPKTDFDKTTVYRAITHHYQVVLMNGPKDRKKELYQMCNWKLYRTVSRTKPRHIVNYIKNRFKSLL